jgi:hypothetical protein
MTQEDNNNNNPKRRLFVRTHCTKCDKVIGWQELKSGVPMIIMLCDDCYRITLRHCTTTMSDR